MDYYKFSKSDSRCIKAVAVIMMLCHHLFTFPEKIKDGASFQSIYTFTDGETLEYVLGDFGKLCVAVFILLSGYGVYKSFHVKAGNYTATIMRQIKNVYIKFWQVFVVFVPIGACLGADNISTEAVDWIKNFFAIETTFNDEWWFLTQYILIMLIMPILFKWLDRKKANPWIDLFCIITFNMLIYTVVVSFVTGNPYFASFSITYYWSKINVCFSMVPMFLMGAYMAKYNIIEKILNYLSNGIKIKLFGGIMLWIVFEMRTHWLQRSQWGWDQMDFIYAALFVISATCLLFQLKSLKKGLDIIGKHSTGIWFIHSFFCYYYWQKIIYAPKNSIIIFLLLFLVSFVSECILTWGYDLLKKKCRKND